MSWQGPTFNKAMIDLKSEHCGSSFSYPNGGQALLPSLSTALCLALGLEPWALERLYLAETKTITGKSQDA
jgi:hypothetical protein